MWKLHKQVLELRFKDCYMYWDRTGEITLRHLAKLPGFEVVKSDPGQTLLKSVKEGLHARYSYEFAGMVHDVEEQPDTDFANRAGTFFETCIKLAEVRELTRIGSRLTYHHYFPKRSEADAFLCSLNKKHSFGGKLLDGWNDKLIAEKDATQFVCRLEDKHTGIRLEITTGEMTAVLTNETKYFVAADADIYTKATVSVDVLHVSELISQNRDWCDKQFIQRL